jgi:hypothetical protein
MAYYPESIMPPVAKSNVAGFSGTAGFVSAERYNMLAAEIVAVETFLGGQATSSDEQSVADNKSSMRNVLGVINNLVREMNLFTDQGLLSTSGYVHSGQRMIFPASAKATFVASPPAVGDTSITVLSTNDFPSSGIISILNDADYSGANTGHSLVEWIAYSNKSGTSFLNCIRGYLGTWAGTHAGLRNPTATSASPKNSLDQCVALPIGTTLCSRRYPGWRYGTIWSFLEFGLAGSIVEVTVAVRRDPASFSLSSSALGSNHDKIIDAAAAAGILGYAGQDVLQSADPAYRALAELSWSEAFTFVASLKTAGVITTLLTPGDYMVDPAPYIPVFWGKMSVEYGTAAVTIVNQNAIDDAGAPVGPVIATAEAAQFTSPTTITLRDVMNTTVTPQTPYLINGAGTTANITSPASFYIIRLAGSNFGGLTGAVPYMKIAATTGSDLAERTMKPVVAIGAQTEDLSSSKVSILVPAEIATAPAWNVYISLSETVTPPNVGVSNVMVVNNPSVPTPAASLTTPVPVTSSMDKLSIIQTADGRLFMDTLSDKVQTVPDQAVVQYKTFFVASSKQG